jgi:NAD(P)-dependent dehydrogenase (short-subunit alcohol dehydrogenase family)
MTRIQGATALVTGAYGGLGRAIVKALRQEGADVVVTGRKAEPLERLAGMTGARAVLADLSQRTDLQRLLDYTGEIDIAVMNAALPASGDIEEWTQEQIDRALEVNLGNPIAMTRALLPAFRRRGSGHFVYISSLSGKVASKGTALYSATKFGLRGFAHGLRCDLVGSGIGCSVVCPGFISDAGMFADTGARLPFGVTTVSPEKVAAGVVRVIRHDKAELDVAPVALKLGAAVGSLVPGFSARVQAAIGGGLPDAVVQAQRDRRS